MNRKLLEAIVENYDLAQDYVREVESYIDQIRYELEDGDVNDIEFDFENLYSDADDVSSYFRVISNVADEIYENEE